MAKELIVSVVDGEEVYQWGENGFPHRGRIGRIMALREGGSEIARRYKPTLSEALEHLAYVTETIRKRNEAMRSG